MGGTPRIETLGCKANPCDSVLIRRELTRLGWRPVGRDDAADLAVVNSCTVTDRADQGSRKAARPPAARRAS